MLYSAEAAYDSESNTHKTVTAILRSLNTPFSQSIVKCLKSKDYMAVVNASINPRIYSNADEFARDYLAYSLVRKLDSFPLGIDTAAAAWKKFLESEEHCALINKTNVSPYRPATCGLSPESYISYARNIIGKMLGPFDWNECAERFAFSGGASTRLPRRSGAPFYKFQGKPETTRNNALLSRAAVLSVPLWASHLASQYGPNPCDWFTIVEGSRLTTVPKTATTDRCIAIEPDMNMYIQKGIGSVIRSRLKSVYIDLNDQSYNQKLAKIGSSTGSLSTIDLASASDSISLELVRLLLPSDWFEALCLCRSEVGFFPNGLKHRFEKISSMGNGYTFELESLIFWGLSKAVISLTNTEDRRLGVYGDDIVIHNSCADVLIEVLDYCGFKTNVEKTFLSGPFRESCGKHYFYGEDVTPFYVKKPLDSLDRRFWAINSFREWCSNRSTGLDRYQGVYTYLVGTVARKHRYMIPYSFGKNAGIWASFDEAAPRYIPWKQSFVCRVYRPRRKAFKPNGVSALLHYFNGVGQDDSRPVSLRDRLGATGVELHVGVEKYRHSKAYISWWDTAPCGVAILGR